jgi:hypothetical protein
MNFCKFEEKAIEVSRSLAAMMVKDFPSIFDYEELYAIQRFIISYIHIRKDYFETFFNNKSTKEIYKIFLRGEYYGHFELKEVIKRNRFSRLLFSLHRKKPTFKSRILPKNKSIIFIHNIKYVRHYLNSGLDLNNFIWCDVSNDLEVTSFLENNFNNVVNLPTCLAPKLAPSIFHSYFEVKMGITKLIAKINPPSVICFEGDAPYNSNLAVIAKQYGATSYCIQWGIHYPCWRDIAFSNMQFDFFISWGRFFSDFLKTNNPGLKFIEHCYFASHSVSGKQRKKVLFIDQGSGGLISDNDQRNLIRLAVDTMNKFPEYEIEYRIHPSELKNETILKVLIENNLSINEVTTPLHLSLAQCCVAVSIFSSGLVEALSQGVIPVLVNVTCLEQYPVPIQEMNLGREFTTFSSCFLGLCDLLNSKDTQEKYLNNIENRYTDLFSKNNDLNSLFKDLEAST